MNDAWTHKSYEDAIYDPEDPDPWYALYLDQSLYLDEGAKSAMLRGNESWSRRLLLPLTRWFIFLLLMCAMLIRVPLGNLLSSRKLLHQSIYFGLKTFVSPDANLLILRHFNIGTEILNFIKDNNPGVAINTVPLRPRKLKDLLDNVFVQHDLNIYNFISELNKGLREQVGDIAAPDRVNFDAITDAPFEFEPFPNTWLNFSDVETAIEYYTPLYSLFLTRHDFVRASNSLQLDETISIYVAKILGSDYHMNLVNNHHPMIPMPALQAGNRLMLHGYDAEALHGYLRILKRQQATAENQ